MKNIKELIEQSNFTEKEKILWTNLFEQSTDEGKEEIMTLFTELVKKQN